jgi:hypothetical protein
LYENFPIELHEVIFQEKSCHLKDHPRPWVRVLFEQLY